MGIELAESEDGNVARHRALMIDVENLSLAPEGWVLQVGWAVAELDGGFISDSGEVWLSEASQAGRKIDLDTVRWWSQQAAPVRHHVFVPEPDSVVSAEQLFELLKALKPDTVWAKPPQMDLSQLRHMWGGATPWGFRQVRCLNTLAAVLDPSELLSNLVTPNRLPHSASADAQWQAEYLLLLWEHLQKVEAGL